MLYRINEAHIPSLAVGFTRSTSVLGDSIAYARGGNFALYDTGYPTHAFLFTRDGPVNGRLFATEETPSGLQERSLETYLQKDNRIVGVYYWKGWNDPVRRDKALQYLVDVRANGGRAAKYDFRGMFSFIPVIGKLFKQDPQKCICSENCASVHKRFGADWIHDTLLAPDQLYDLMRACAKDNVCDCILNYYL